MKKLSRVRAFSLVEVVIALGITTFAITAIMTMMPVGLSTLRSAMDDTMTARMIRKVSSDLQMTPFSQITSGDILFDVDGEVVVTEADARYRVTYANKAYGANTYPGASANIGDDLLSVEGIIYRVAGNTNIRVGAFPIAVSRSE